MTASKSPQILAAPKNAPKQKPLPAALHPRTHHFVWSPDHNLDELPSLLWGWQSLKAAQALRDYWAINVPEAKDVIVRMDVTFTIVEGGDDD